MVEVVPWGRVLEKEPAACWERFGGGRSERGLCVARAENQDFGKKCNATADGAPIHTLWWAKRISQPFL